MDSMFCPRCGHDLAMESEAVRFCRFCGLRLGSAWEALEGHDEVKRQGWTLASWAYPLLLAVVIAYYFGLLPSDELWVRVLAVAAVVASVSLFVAGGFAVERPAPFATKGKRALDGGTPDAARRDRASQTAALDEPRRAAELPLPQEETLPERPAPPSVAESTTRRMPSRGNDT